MQLLQVSEATAAQRRLFMHIVDATDGISPEAGLTGVGRISKNGAATAASSGSLVEIDATNMPGRYYIELTQAEVDTVGIIEFRYKAAACAEVVARGQVVPYDPYDAVRMGLTALPNAAADAAGGLPISDAGGLDLDARLDAAISTRATPAQVNTEVDTALADVNLDHLVGTATAIPAIPAGTYIDQMMDDGTAVYDRTTDSLQAIRDSGGGAPTVGQIADAVWDEAIAGHLGAGSTGLALNSASSAGDPWSTALPGAYGAGTAGNIVGNNLDAAVSTRATPTNITAGTITTVTNLTNLPAITANWLTAAGIAAGALNGKGDWNIGKTGYALSAAGVQAIWDALTSALTTVGSIGKLLVDNINATISSRSSHTAADVWAVATRILTAGTNIVLAKGTGVTGFNDLSAAQVNAEVVDALAVDTYAEPGQGAPAATTTLAAKINFLFKAWRNRKTQTASQFSLYNDAAAVIDQKATFSDDTVTADIGEISTGP